MAGENGRGGRDGSSGRGGRIGGRGRSVGTIFGPCLTAHKIRGGPDCEAAPNQMLDKLKQAIQGMTDKYEADIAAMVEMCKVEIKDIIMEACEAPPIKDISGEDYGMRVKGVLEKYDVETKKMRELFEMTIKGLQYEYQVAVEGILWN